MPASVFRGKKLKAAPLDWDRIDANVVSRRLEVPVIHSVPLCTHCWHSCDQTGSSAFQQEPPGG